MNLAEMTRMRSLDYTGRTVIEGHSRAKDAWGSLRRDGVQPEDGWGTLPDGRGIYHVLEQGDVDHLLTSYIHLDHSGAHGDMLWSGSMMTAFVSAPFVDAIRAAGITGYTLVPLEVRPKRGPRFSGYSLLLPDNRDPQAHIRSFPFPFRPTVALDVSPQVVDALRAGGVTSMRMSSATERATLLLESD